MEEGVEEVPLGLYLVKGDQMCVSSSDGFVRSGLRFMVLVTDC